MDEWISVKDRLPFKCELILAINDNNEECDRIAMMASFSGGKFYYDHTFEAGYSEEIDGITHWMQLPSTPSG